MLHRNSKFSIIDIQTGATSIFVYGVSFIQQLCNEPSEIEREIDRSSGMDKDGNDRAREEGRECAFAFRYMPANTEAIVVRVLIHCQKPLNNDAGDVSYPPSPNKIPLNKRP